jgi:hypothetical protein
MNILLWVLQVLLALHTAMGAVWKLSNPEQTVAPLSALPHPAWLALAALELLCVLGLILPVIKRLGFLAPVAAAFVASEMLLYCGLFLYSGSAAYGLLAYWLVVAVFSAFIAYGRSVLKPIKAK